MGITHHKLEGKRQIILNSAPLNIHGEHDHRQGWCVRFLSRRFLANKWDRVGLATHYPRDSCPLVWEAQLEEVAVCDLASPLFVTAILQ